MHARHLTKADLIDAVCAGAGLSKKDASMCVTLFFSIIRRELEIGGRIKLSGFGNFDMRLRPARNGRNPQSGAALRLAARHTLTFKPSQILRLALNVMRNG